jgi:hypothetical protein
MEYAQAFRKLGYELGNPRNDVSAENADGIALAIIRIELEKSMIFDTRDIPDWETKRMPLPGNQRRIQHLKRATEEFESRVNVVLFDRKSDGKSANAEPWIRPPSYWKVTHFDPTTGHHRVELVRS